MLGGLGIAVIASGCPSGAAELPTSTSAGPADEGTTGGTGPGITVDSLVTGIDSAGSTDSDGSGGGGGSEDTGDPDTTDTDPGATTNTQDTDGGSEGTDDTGSTGGDPMYPLPPYCNMTIPVSGDNPLIDDLEIEMGELFPDATIPEIDDRVGFWFTYNDETPAGMQTPSPGGFQPADMGAQGTEYGAQTFGEGFQAWGAGMAVAINNDFDGSCPYDASAYDGIRFWARGNRGVRFMVATRSTVHVDDGGTCDPTTDPEMLPCEDHYGVFMELTETWTEYIIPWTDLDQQMWGKDGGAFDPGLVMQLEWQATDPEPFDFTIDEVQFWTAP